MYPSCLHTHTEFCDGHSTMRRMIGRAIELKYSSLGFSPHSPLPYNNDWAMKKEDLPRYFEEFEALKKEFSGQIELYAGIELDADSAGIADLYPFDFVIGAVHSLVKKGERFSVDYKKELLEDVVSRLYGGDFPALCADYFDAVAKNALKKEINIVAHFDLPTKYNKDGAFVDENDRAYLSLAEKAIDRIFDKRKDLYFEVNTGCIPRAGKAHPYPAPAIMRMLAERGAQFIITCDCHRSELLGVGYERATEDLRACGVNCVFLFRSGEFQPFRL